MSDSRESFDGRHKEEPIKGNDKVPDWGAGEEDPHTEQAQFTEEECNILQRYIWEIRDILGLSHWDVYLSRDYAEDTAQASVHPLFGRHIAAIYINRLWFTYSPEDQRNAMVHEMLHIVHNSQTDIVRVGYSQVIKNKLIRNAMWSMFENQTELMVDHLANHLAPLMPFQGQKIVDQILEDLNGI